MPVLRRLPIVLALAAGAGALSAPAALAAAPADGQGVVLSRGGHGVRLVDKAHRVGAVRVGSTRGLRRGDVVRVKRGRARVTGHVRRVAFLGRVVRSSARSALVRLGDGSTFKLAGRRPQHRRAAIDLQGLTAGEALLITLATGERGDVVTIKRLRPATQVVGSDDEGCDDAQADDADDPCAGDPGDEDLGDDEVDGTITALAGDGSALTLAPDDGSAETTYPVEDPILLDGIAVGDEVAVTLDEDGTAIDVELLDWSDEPDPGDDGGGFDDDQ